MIKKMRIAIGSDQAIWHNKEYLNSPITTVVKNKQVEDSRSTNFYNKY